jgi:hypothetical protein
LKYKHADRFTLSLAIPLQNADMLGFFAPVTPIRAAQGGFVLIRSRRLTPYFCWFFPGEAEKLAG